MRNSECDKENLFKYPVFEQFHSWQGEGLYQGQSAYFIRLFGCPIRCEWCDSAGTWDGTQTGQVESFSAETLAENAAAARPDFVVVTGGEPAIHNLSPLCESLHKRGLKVHLETSGAFPICGEIDWITMSPKARRLPLSENWTRAAEIKFIITCPEDISFWVEKMKAENVSSNSPVWLHPEWSQHANPQVLNAISAFVCENGFPFRAGWQLHKLFNVQ